MSMSDYNAVFRFVEKWQRASLKEKASAQSHFDDVCRMLGQPTPAEADPDGDFFTYEYGVQKSSGRQGYADVWYKDHFAIEYKGKGKYNNLSEAYEQLLRYKDSLRNPPLLIICDVDRWEIHTNWPNTVHQVYRFTNREILFPENQRILLALFEDPDRLNPNRTAEQVTVEAADLFRTIADEIRDQYDSDILARFLIRLMFCLFAEDADLLPTMVHSGGKGMFSTIVEETRGEPEPDRFIEYTRELFHAMAVGGDVFLRKIPYFNGAMFTNGDVLPLSHEALEVLWKACQLDWSDVDPSIFGTLFERVLDPAKRAQLGAHYTSRDDIILIVEPVLMAPLRREWQALQAETAPIRAAYDAATTARDKEALGAQLLGLRDGILARLRSVRVLDPACGSGNFLYVALQLLLDLEKAVLIDPLWRGLGRWFDDFVIGVHPRQFYGIEIEPVAHALASAVIWIGYLQWNLRNGYFKFREQRIMDPVNTIEERDAVLTFDEAGSPVEPEWPEVDVIVSNPPFLGGQRMREELGDEYVSRLRSLYGDRLPGQSDLVCYWFEQARRMIEQGKAKRAGLLATSTIHQVTNRAVLERIKQTGNIFMAWSDREWVLEGAAVRISVIGFDNGKQEEYLLNGLPVTHINVDLKASVDLSTAQALPENTGIAFMGDTKGGPFDLPANLARQMLDAPNPGGRSNRDVVRPWVSGADLTDRRRDNWIIDFGAEMDEEEAALYELPFQYVKEHVLSQREARQREEYRRQWWRHVRPRPELRQATGRLSRFIVTPLVSKHRLFAWLEPSVPDARLIAFARSDDYFFGVLHSRLHEVWSLRLGARHGGERPTYNISTCFETFPFPWLPGQEPADHPAHRAISAAARQLHQEREMWLNPPGLPGELLKKRTLTKLYNALAEYRISGVGSSRPMAVLLPDMSAGDFALRLAELHDALDRAVCDAYGWPHDILSDEEEMLRRLLALNTERTGLTA